MPRGFKRNCKEATEARHYLDPESFVTHTLDGSLHEILYGEDWEARKAELWERDGGKCQWKFESRPICGIEANDPHHKENGIGERCDCLHNLISLCRRHHDIWHGNVKGRRVRWSSGEKTP